MRVEGRRGLRHGSLDLQERKATEGGREGELTLTEEVGRGGAGSTHGLISGFVGRIPDTTVYRVGSGYRR